MNDGMNDSHIEAAKVIDDPVIGKNDAVIGIIRDLLIDERDGRIDYACVELRGRSPGKRVAIVPWSQFRVAPRGTIRLDVSHDTLVAFSRWQSNRKEENRC